MIMVVYVDPKLIGRNNLLKWVRENSKLSYDKIGEIAEISGPAV